VKVSRNQVLVAGDSLESVKLAVGICSKITCWVVDMSNSQKTKVPLVQLDPDPQFPEIYLSNFVICTNSKATVIETKIISAFLSSGVFESLYPPYQDTVATCYYFKTKECIVKQIQ